MSNLPLSLKTPPAGSPQPAGRGGGGSSSSSSPPPLPSAGGSQHQTGAGVVSQNIAAIVGLPQAAKPEVLSRSGNDAILRVGTSVMSVSGLKQDLHTVQRHIGFERERRLEAEKLFASESESLLDQDQAKAVQRREEELARLHEERTAMIEFLKRGTDEAKRISAEVTNLKARANEKEIAEGDLSAEREHLEALLTKLTSELNDHQGQFENLTKKRDEMEQRQAELNALATSTENQTVDLQTKLEPLKADLESRMVSARKVEAMETAMGVISASSRRLLHELEHINSNVVKISDERIAATTDPNATAVDIDKELEAATVAPDFDSEVEAEDTRITSVVGATARTKFARCSSIVKAMLTALLRYDMEIAARLVKTKKQHEAEAAGVMKYLQETKEQCAEELETWKKKYEQREDQLRKANAFRNKAVTDSLKEHEDALADQGGSGSARSREAEKALLESAFSLTNYFERIMQDTQQDLNQVRGENAKLKDKVDRYSKDYALVKDLRQQYREMETQKISLESTLRAADSENRRLKQLMGGGTGADHLGGGGGEENEKPRGGGRRHGAARRPWRGNTFT